MNFNPDPSKQAEELLFNWKTSSKPYPSLNFNDNPVHQVPLQKHLGLFLDPKLKFWWTYSMHLNQKTQNNRINQKAAASHTKGSIVNNL